MVADCAEEITKGFKQVFELEKRVYCCVLVLRIKSNQKQIEVDSTQTSKVGSLVGYC